MASGSSLWKLIKSKVSLHPGHKDLLLQLHKDIQCGVPEHPTALAHDPQLDLLAIGTAFGLVKVFGSPGVEVNYQQAKNVPVKHLFFLHGQGRIVVIYENGLLELLELRNVAGVSELQLGKDASFSSVVDLSCASMAKNTLFLGTSKGMLFSVQLPSLELQDESKVLEARQPTQLTEAQSPSVANHVVAIGMETAAVPGESRAKSEYAQLYGEKSSAVLALAPHPLKADVLAVGMAGGRIFICDLTAKVLLNTFYHDQEVTGLAWSSAGTSLYAAFHDGGYLSWDTADNALKGKPVIPYGPFPCLPMRRMTVYSDNELVAPWIVFEGGLPPRFQQHNSLTILNNDKHDVFDFPAPIVDYFLLDRTEGAISRPHTLMVLLNNQLVAIDLTADKFPEISAPYLFSMHAPITAFQYLSGVAPAVLKDLADVTSKPSELRPFGGFLHTVSQREWPLLGGRMVQDTDSKSGLLLTAHGDGSVRFWEVSSGKVRFLHRVAAPTRYYYIDQDNVDYTDDNFDVWPPFRKYGVGAGEICDQRLRIEQLFFDPASRMLAVAGQAGRVMLYTFSDNYAVVDFQTIGVPLVGEDYDFVWRGCQPLPHRSGNLEEFAGFQGQLNIQLYPPSQITSLHMHPQWKLLAVGTSYGVALIQYANRACVWSQCTLDRGEEGALLHPAAGGGSLSFQQKARLAGDTLRRSLRRIPRPHIPLRTPSSPLVENGKTGKYRPVEPEPASPDAVIALRIEEERVAAPSPGEIKPPTPIIPTEDILKETARNSMIQVVNGETVEVVKEHTEVVNGVKETHLSDTIITVEVDKTPANAEETEALPLVIVEAEKAKEVQEKERRERIYDCDRTSVRSVLLEEAVVDEGLMQPPSASCLFVGLNNGSVYIYRLDMPALMSGGALEAERSVTAVKLVKEIHLRHGAPVIFMAVVPGWVSSSHRSSSKPTKSKTMPVLSANSESAPAKAEVATTSAEVTEEQPQPMEVASPVSTEAPMTPPPTPTLLGKPLHGRLLLVSEEQMKMFQLPSLKAVCKHKLTHGKFTRAQIVRMPSQVDYGAGEVGGERRHEWFVAGFTNKGDLEMVSLPGLKRQSRITLYKKDDLGVSVNGNGHGVYQSGSNQLQLFSVCTALEQGKDSRKGGGCVVDVPQVVVEEVKEQPEEKEPTAMEEKKLESPTVETVELQDVPVVVVLTAAVAAPEVMLTDDISIKDAVAAPLDEIAAGDAPQVLTVSSTVIETMVEDDGEQVVTRVFEEMQMLLPAGDLSLAGGGDALQQVLDSFMAAGEKELGADGEKELMEEETNVADLSSDSIIDHTRDAVSEEELQATAKKLGQEFAKVLDNGIDETEAAVDAAVVSH